MSRFNHRDFARRLREMRISLELSEQQAADEAGRSVETWRKYETTGRGRITGALVSLAKHHIGAIDWQWVFEGGRRRESCRS